MDKTCRTCLKFDRTEADVWCPNADKNAGAILLGIKGLCPEWKPEERRTCRTCAYYIPITRDPKGGWCWNPIPNGYEARGINAETLEKGCGRWEAKG